MVASGDAWLVWCVCRVAPQREEQGEGRRKVQPVGDEVWEAMKATFETVMWKLKPEEAPHRKYIEILFNKATTRDYTPEEVKKMVNEEEGNLAVESWKKDEPGCFTGKEALEAWSDRGY